VAFCNTCCEKRWNCWWSMRTYQSFDDSWKLLVYFVPYVFGTIPQALFTIFLTWLFEAFSRIK
jgi:hypothetical protein